MGEEFSFTLAEFGRNFAEAETNATQKAIGYTEIQSDSGVEVAVRTGESSS